MRPDDDWRKSKDHLVDRLTAIENSVRRLNVEIRDALWAIFFVLIFIAIGTCLPAHAEWVEVPATKPQQGGGVVADVRSHLPDQSIMAGQDTVGLGHYGSHGMSAYLRNKHGGTGRVNAVYLGDGLGLVLPEPKGFALSDVIQRAGTQLPAGEAVRWWQNEPLYVLDEQSAYLCGTTAGVEGGADVTRVRGSFRFARQMHRLSRAVLSLAVERGYRDSDARDLRIYVDVTGGALDELERRAPARYRLSEVK